MLSAMAGRGPLSSCGTLVTGGGRSVLHGREDRDRDEGFVLTDQLMTLGVSTMVYVIEEDGSPVGDPNGPSRGIPLIPVSATEVWGHLSSWMWATS